MDMLVNGVWRKDEWETTNEDGAFERQETTFRDRLGTKSYPVETGRYHLYISRACPWAHGTAMVRSLLELEEHISLSLVQPERYDEGWEFSVEYPDPYHNFEFLRELYQLADEDFTGRVTVPVLWDKKTDSIVNNESSEIMEMLNDEFGGMGNDTDLYPDSIKENVLDTIEDIYEPINNGVYKAGFADNQEEYTRAVSKLFDALDHWDEVLERQRYLIGDKLTAADLRMFATLVRFDHVYNTHFKCNVRTLHEYDNLWGYTKDIYQTEGVTKTVNMDHIVRHYYRSHEDINPKRLVPKGPDIDFSEEHERNRI